MNAFPPIWYLVSLSLFFYSPFCQAANADAWRSRSIYQIITDRFALPQSNPSLPGNACHEGDHTWCGGNWASIQQNLDYIQGMGFTAIWISPVAQNIPGPTAYGNPYHGYWVQNVTQLNDKFGTSDDLRSLVSALHARNMYIMIDIVVNNVAATSSTFNPDYSPYLFTDKSYYHPYLPVQFGNATSEQIGWLGDDKLPLPDLNTSHPTVRSELQLYIKNFVADYEIDGLRIDAAKHVEPGFWPSFCNENGAAGVFCIGEVFGSNVSIAAPWQGPLDSILNYPTYNALVDTFTVPGAQNMTGLVSIMNQSRVMFKDVSILGNFLENQDVPRWAGLSDDPATLTNALVYSFLTEGIPVMYYGIEQRFKGQVDPYNREPLWPSNYTLTSTYQTISTLNRFRNFLINNSQRSWLSDNSTILSHTLVDLVLSKGGAISVLNVFGSSASNHTTLIQNTGYQSNTVLTDVLSCSRFVVASQGAIAVTYNLGSRPLVLYPAPWLAGSGLCGTNATNSNTNGSSADTNVNAAHQRHLPPNQLCYFLAGVSLLIFCSL